MFFYAAKLLWILLKPSSLVLLVLVLGFVRLLRTGRRAGHRLIATGIVLYLILGFSPLGNLLVIPLETRIPAPGKALVGPLTGIVVLGGGEDSDGSTEDLTALNDSGDRMTEAVVLARRFPEAKLVFAGGTSNVVRSGMTGASIAKRFFAELGVDGSRVLLEGDSRNTWENAVLTRDLVRPEKGQRWILVTSAFHMPRALGCFRKAGFDVEPYPVDYRTHGWRDAGQPFDAPSDGLMRVDTVVKEYVGLVVYWVTGKSSELFPGPRP